MPSSASSDITGVTVAWCSEVELQQVPCQAPEHTTQTAEDTAATAATATEEAPPAEEPQSPQEYLGKS